VGATTLAHFDYACPNPSVKHSPARITAKPDESFMLRHAFEVLLVLVWIDGPTNSPALCADQMEKARKKHLNVEIVHVNGKQKIELDPFGCLWQQNPHDPSLNSMA
jgi:hypothetical protein